jgi:hypothetical protein
MKILKTKKYSILSNILKFNFIFIFILMLSTPFVFVNALEISTKINNPLGTNGPQNIPAFIEALIGIVLIVGIPIVVLAIIYTGFLFVKAQGNPEEITKAKNALMYTLIGATLLLGAFVIANAIGKTVDEIKSSS